MEREQTTAERVKKRIERQDNRFWQPSDFSDERYYDAVLRQLARMADNKELIRIRRGLYWRGRQGSAGMTRPKPLQVAQAIIGPDGVGYAAQSAAYELGLTFQQPVRDQIAVPLRPPRAITALRADFLSRAGRVGRLQHHLMAREVALLEVLATPEVIEVADRVALEKLSALLLHADDVRPRHLVRAAGEEPAIVREGLRNLLAAIGQEDEAKRVPRARSRAARAKAFLAEQAKPQQPAPAG